MLIRIDPHGTRDLGISPPFIVKFNSDFQQILQRIIFNNPRRPGDTSVTEYESMDLTDTKPQGETLKSVHVDRNHRALHKNVNPGT
jgi:hypothetical protein